MEPQTDLPDLIEDYEANIDDLSSALAPLLSTPLHTTTSTLPLLDKAKLQVLSAYAIESLLFSVLQASGINAKDHAIFKELARLKTYFAKIKTTEALGEQPKMRLDKEAVARFINAGLAGNDRYDKERVERLAKERAKASVKAALLNKKFDPVEEDKKQAELAKQTEEANKRKTKEMYSQDDERDSSASEKNHVDTENEDFYGVSAAATPKASKKPKKDKKEKKGDKKHKKRASAAATLSTESSTPRSTDKESRRAKKVAKRLQKAGSISGQKKTAEVLIPEKSSQAPNSRSQTFSALLDGSFAETRKDNKMKQGKK